MPFGYLLRRLRVEKGLSQRRLAEISGVDHGYIDCLESRKKESPSPEVVGKLAGGLGLTGREAWLLGYVAKYREYADVRMIEYALEHPEITRDEFSWAVALKYRRPGKLDYPELFGCARLIVELVDDFLRWESDGLIFDRHSSV